MVIFGMFFKLKHIKTWTHSTQTVSIFLTPGFDL